jgi:hypothetical protein
MDPIIMDTLKRSKLESKLEIYEQFSHLDLEDKHTRDLLRELFELAIPALEKELNSI